MKTSHLPEAPDPKAEVQESYIVRRIDNGYIVQFRREEYMPHWKINISISWRSIIIAIAILAIVVIPYVDVVSNSQTQESTAYTTTESENDAMDAKNDSFNEASIESQWKSSGFLFPDSDKRILTEADILSLAAVEGYSEAELLRYAVNEIYARHHYSFTSEKYYDFFCAQDWYSGDLSAEDACALFNSTEQQNLAFLLQAEEKYK